MSKWVQYDSEESIGVLKQIANESEDASRVAFLEAAKDSEKFVSYIKSLIRDNGGRLLHMEGNRPQFPEKMDEGTYKNISWKIQGRELWDSMKDMSPIDACRPGLWLYVALQAIEEGIIQSHFLAAGTNGANQTGISAIENALRTGNTLVLSRLILRRMFGAISQRGTKAVFTDVPFAKVWWQRHISEEVAQGGVGISANEMTAFFMAPNRGFIYEELTRCMSSLLTFIADKPVRNGLMHFYFNAAKDEGAGAPTGFKIGRDDFRMLTKRVGIMSAWRAMGVIKALENSRIIGECAAEIGRGEFA